MATETELERLVVRLVMKSGHKQALNDAIRDFDGASKDITGAVKIIEASVATAMGNIGNVTRAELREAAAVIQKTRTEYEQFGLDMTRLDSLYQRNLIGQETYTRAVKELRSTLPGVSENLRENAAAAKEIEAITRRNETAQESYLRQSKRLKDLLNSGLSVDVYARELAALQAKLPGAIDRQRQLTEASREQGAALRRAASLVSKNAAEHERFAQSLADLQTALNAGKITSQQYTETVEQLRAKLPEQVAATRNAERAQRELNDQIARAKEIVSNQTPEMRQYAQGIDDLQAALAVGEIGLDQFRQGVERLRNQLPEQVEAARAAEQAQTDLNDQIARAKQLVSNQTPAMRAYAQGIDDLQVALHQGEITQRQFTEAAERLRQTLPEQVAAARAAEQAQQELASAIQRGIGLAKSAETAQEQYEAQLVDLRAALDAGEISQTHFNRAVDKLKPKLPGITARLKKFGDQMRSVSQSVVAGGQRLSMFVTLPITAAGAAFVKLGSDAIETKNKFSAVFSTIQNEAAAAARVLDESYGMASTQSKQLLADTGDLLTGFGFSQQSALEMSTEVQKLAADLASFTNIEGGAERASDALTKALLGEREAAKSLGIAILENDVQARVAINAAKGMTFANERAAKAFATLQIAQEQSKNAIGDYGRTSKEFANQFKEFKNDIRDVSEAFGELLLPIAAKALGLFRDGLQWVKGLSRENKLLIAGLSAAAAAVGPLLVAVGSVGGAIGGISAGLPVLAGIGAAIAPALPIIAGVVAALAAVGAAAVWLVGTDGLVGAWQTVTEATVNYGKMAMGFIVNFRENMSALSSWFRDNWTTILTNIPQVWLSVWGTVLKNFTHNMGVAITTLSSLWVAFQGWLFGRFKNIFTRDFVNAVISGIKTAFGMYQKFTDKLGDMVWNALTGLGKSDPGAFLDQLKGDFAKGVKETNFFDTARDILRDGLADVKLPLSDLKVDLGVKGPALNFDMPTLPKIAPPEVPKMPSIPAMDTAGATEALDANADAMKRGAKIAEANRTSLERFNAEKRDLLKLLKVGAINQTTYQRAVAKAAAEYQKATEHAEKPARAMTDAARTLKDIATPVETFNVQLVSLKSQLATGAISVEQFGSATTAAIKNLNKDAIKTHERLAKEGAKVMEDFRSPLEKYHQRMSELRELADTGAIDMTTFARATKEAVGELAKANAERRAATSGSINVHAAGSPEAIQQAMEGIDQLRQARASAKLAEQEIARQGARREAIKAGKLPAGASEATREAFAAARRGAAAARAVEAAKAEALAARGRIPRNPLPTTVTQPPQPRFAVNVETTNPRDNRGGEQFAAWQREDVIHVVEFLRVLSDRPEAQVVDI